MDHTRARSCRRAGIVIAAALSVAAALLVSGPWIARGMPTDAATYLALTGSTGGAVRAVARFGDHAYVAVGHRMAIVARHPGTAAEWSPPEVAQRLFHATVADVASDGAIAYVAHGARVTILDASEPTEPRHLGAVEVWTPSSDLRRVVADEGIVLVGLGYMSYRGWTLVDARDPAAPRAEESYDDLYLMRPDDLALEDGVAYLVVGDVLRLVDVREPTDAVLLGETDLRAPGRGIAVQGDYAYVTTESGLVTLDVASPTDPEIVSTVAVSGSRAAADGRMLAIAGDEGLTLLDLADPARPVLAHQHAIGRVSSVHASDGWTAAVVSDSGAFGIDHEPWGAAGGVPRTVLRSWRPATAIALDGDDLYVAANDGLALVSVADASAPKTVWLASLEAPGVSVAVSSGVATVALEDGKIVVLDVAGPSSPAAGDAIDTDAGRALVAMDGSTLTTAGGTRLRTFDVGDVSDVRALGRSDALEWDPVSLLVDGGAAYVLDQREGLHVFDVRTPAHKIAKEPGLSFRGPDYAHGLALDGDQLFAVHDHEPVATPASERAATGAVPDVPPPPPENRVLGLDVRNRLAPSIEMDFAPLGWPRGLAVTRGRLLAASGFAPYYAKRLIAHDLDGGEPERIELPLPSVPRGIRAHDGIAFVALGDDGVAVYELRDGPAPTSTPWPTRVPDPTGTIDPHATPTPTSPFETATPLPTPTPTPTGASPTPLFLPVASHSYQGWGVHARSDGASIDPR